MPIITNQRRGDISLYMVLIVSTMMLSSAVLLGLILAQQISLTKDLVASERAFYAASSGIEEGFYRLALRINQVELRAKGQTKINGQPAPAEMPPSNVEGTIDYSGNVGTTTATYKGSISRHRGAPCGVLTGTFMGEQRRIQIGPDVCVTNPSPP